MCSGTGLCHEVLEQITKNYANTFFNNPQAVTSGLCIGSKLIGSKIIFTDIRPVSGLVIYDDHTVDLLLFRGDGSLVLETDVTPAGSCSFVVSGSNVLKVSSYW